MSQLISSAIAGKKAAPKAPPRRRLQPAAPSPAKPTPTPTEATPAPTQDAPAVDTEQRDVAPPSPPPTQVLPQPEPTPQPTRQPEVAPPRQATPPPPPPPPRDPTPPPRPAPNGFDDLEAFVRQQTPPSLSAQREELAVQLQPIEGPAEQAQATAEAELSRAQALEAATKSTRTRQPRKRKNDEAQTPQQAKPAAKRQKRSSARSNATVQAQVNEDVTMPDAQAADAAASLAPNAVVAGPDVEGQAPKKARAPRIAKAPTKPRAKRAPKKKSDDLVPEEDRVPVDGQEQGDNAANTAVQTTEGAPEANPAAAPKKRAVRRRRKPIASAAEIQAAIEAGGTEEAQPDGEAGRKSKKKKPDPELHVIDPKTVSMWDMTRNTKNGKVSEREKAMREINWDEVKQKQREAAELAASGQQQRDKEAAKEQAKAEKEKERQAKKEQRLEQKKKCRKRGKKGDAEDVQGEDAVRNTTEGADGTVEHEDGSQAPAEDDAEAGADRQQPEGEENDADSASTPAGLAGPQFVLVNGELVLDESSIQLPQAETALNPTATDDVVAVEEENDLTQRINRTTWINDRRREPAERVPLWKRKGDPWGEEETERFYAALISHGTDFSTIQGYFPNKSRRQIKTKFTREERLDPRRIRLALVDKVGTATVTLAQYADAVGRDVSFYNKYEGRDHAEAQIKIDMAEREAVLRGTLAEAEETARQREVQAAQQEEGKRRKEAERAEKKAEKRALKRGAGRKGAGTLGG